MTVRPYKHEDYEMICGWWRDHGEPVPQAGLMAPECTLVLECDGWPEVTLSYFITQNKNISFLEGFCSSPLLKDDKRRLLVHFLWDYTINFLKEKGCTRTVIFADNINMARRYIELGMHLNAQGIYALGKDFLCLG